MDNDKRVVKYNRMLRRCCINIMAWQENNPNPTDEEAETLDVLFGKLKDAKTNYREHIRQGNWVKHSYVSEPIDESRLVEQQEWLDEVQGTHGDKIADGN